MLPGASAWRRARAGIAEAQIDPPVRVYLRDIVDMQAVSRPCRLLFARANRFFTVGLLPPELRTQMGYDWTDADERRLDRTLSRIGAVYRHCRRGCASFR